MSAAAPINGARAEYVEPMVPVRVCGGRPLSKLLSSIPPGELGREAYGGKLPPVSVRAKLGISGRLSSLTKPTSGRVAAR